MEIILKEDVKGLGYANDTVDVKPGYGRNFLIPQGKAILGNKSNKKMIAEILKQASHKLEKIKADAEDLAAKMGEIKIELKAKVGENGKIFGAITTLQVSDALKEKGFEVDRKKIYFDEDIKFTGEYLVTLDLHKTVKHKLNVTVEAE